MFSTSILLLKFYNELQCGRNWAQFAEAVIDELECLAFNRAHILIEYNNEVLEFVLHSLIFAPRMVSKFDYFVRQLVYLLPHSPHSCCIASYILYLVGDYVRELIYLVHTSEQLIDSVNVKLSLTE